LARGVLIVGFAAKSNLKHVLAAAGDRLPRKFFGF
jgi:hypothetical protein